MNLTEILTLNDEEYLRRVCEEHLRYKEALLDIIRKNGPGGPYSKIAQEALKAQSAKGKA